LRRIDESAPDVWSLKAKSLAKIESKVHYLAPANWSEWVCAPTSGNCFRRDALALFLGVGSILNLKFHGDTYLISAATLVAAAVLIDIPLTVYRIHGGNGYVGHPELSGVNNADARKSFEALYFTWRAIVDRLIEDCALFIQKLGVLRYREALVSLQGARLAHPAFPEFDDLSDYIEDKLKAGDEDLTVLLGRTEFDRTLSSVRIARAAQPRSAPRPIVRPFAELLLTTGRVFKAAPLSRLGEKLWRS